MGHVRLLFPFFFSIHHQLNITSCPAVGIPSLKTYERTRSGWIRSCHGKIREDSHRSVLAAITDRWHCNTWHLKSSNISVVYATKQQGQGRPRKVKTSLWLITHHDIRAY